MNNSAFDRYRLVALRDNLSRNNKFVMMKELSR